MTRATAEQVQATATLVKRHRLTALEAALLQEIHAGMDAPGCGWLHEITSFQNDHITAGVLGSLIKKGLVRSEKDEECVPGFPPAYWLTLAE